MLQADIISQKWANSKYNEVFDGTYSPTLLDHCRLILSNRRVLDTVNGSFSPEISYVDLWKGSSKVGWQSHIAEKIDFFIIIFFLDKELNTDSYIETAKLRLNSSMPYDLSDISKIIPHNRQIVMFNCLDPRFVYRTISLQAATGMKVLEIGGKFNFQCEKFKSS